MATAADIKALDVTCESGPQEVNRESAAPSYVIAGRVYPALFVGDHDGEPFARLPLESGLVVEVHGWSDADEVSLFLIDATREEGIEDPDLCWSGVLTAASAVMTIAEWSTWTVGDARRWYAAHAWDERR